MTVPVKGSSVFFIVCVTSRLWTSITIAMVSNGENGKVYSFDAEQLFRFIHSVVKTEETTDTITCETEVGQ